VYEPLVETRNRKLRRPNPLAPWQLRVGQLRVFYEVTADEPQVVHILAVGQKKGNRLLILGIAAAFRNGLFLLSFWQPLPAAQRPAH
jgi:hypothetical protein